MEVPEDFSFPFSPYSIQEDFMKCLFNVLEEKKLGIFESPTGTGKSLSLICGALTWLRNHKKFRKEFIEKELNEKKTCQSNDDFDWFTTASQALEQNKKIVELQKELEVIKKQDERISELKQRRKGIKSTDVKKLKNDFDSLYTDYQNLQNEIKKEVSLNDNILNPEEMQFLVNDYCSDDEDSEGSGDLENADGGNFLKIFYCSRTHSQLSQFVREIKKTKFGKDARIVSLASRQNICINNQVLSLSNYNAVNERCLELQRSSTKTYKIDSKCNKTVKKTKMAACPFYKTRPMNILSDQVLLEVQDLEEIVQNGKLSKICPYYATRHAVQDAESTREGTNINLKDCVVIVDEAHNLLETISNVYSVTLSYSQLTGTLSQLSQYIQRYEKRLTAKNLLYLKQLKFFVTSLIKKVTAKEINASSDCTVMNVSDFLYSTLTDNLNYLKLLKYIEKSKIELKLFGFSQSYHGLVQSAEPVKQANMSEFLSKIGSANKQHISGTLDDAEMKNENQSLSSLGSPLMQVTAFIKAIIGVNRDGRIVINCSSTYKDCSIKYFMLNPGSQFCDIVKECRSIILAGGTMKPTREFREHLFFSAGASPDRIVEFSCGHIVDTDQFLPIALSNGPTNVQYEFTYQKRNSSLQVSTCFDHHQETSLQLLSRVTDTHTQLDELGRVLANVSTIVFGGIVCFLPSYDYLEFVINHFKTSGILQRISSKKKVFFEPKKSSSVDSVLSEYSKTIKNVLQFSNLNGAFLFSVVGGKMSEGINFGDDLGRLVIVVGLPYPNSQSPELIEKMKYLNKHMEKLDGKSAGSVYYENLCFRAVNQSIGRVIRHRDDFACILLLDHRYSYSARIEALPEWVSSSVRICDSFGQAYGLLRKFYAERKGK